MSKGPLHEKPLASISTNVSSSESSTLDPQPTLLISDHELLHRIGRGSYGEVWLARNIMGEHRAVKVVYRRSFGDNRPFEREFEGIQRYEPISRSHESQVQILHVGRNQTEEYFYYVMELADDARGESERVGKWESEKASPSGKADITPAHSPTFSPAQYAPRTLRHELERHGRLPLTDCINIGLALTTALEHLHQHGLVHRDIKPRTLFS